MTRLDVVYLRPNSYVWSTLYRTLLCTNSLWSCCSLASLVLGLCLLVCHRHRLVLNDIVNHLPVEGDLSSDLYCKTSRMSYLSHTWLYLNGILKQSSWCFLEWRSLLFLKEYPRIDSGINRSASRSANRFFVFVFLGAS